MRILDTAGMRRAVRIDDPLEYFSLLRAQRVLERVDVALLVVDANEGVTGHDQRIAEEIASGGRACVDRDEQVGSGAQGPTGASASGTLHRPTPPLHAVGAAHPHLRPLRPRPPSHRPGARGGGGVSQEEASNVRVEQHHPLRPRIEPTPTISRRQRARLLRSAGCGEPSHGAAVHLGPPVLPLRSLSRGPDSLRRALPRLCPDDSVEVEKQTSTKGLDLFGGGGVTAEARAAAAAL